LCHSRTIAETDRIEVFKGSIEDRDCVDCAMRDVTHVIHFATCKEIPETVMDVTVKGLFWLLEAFRQSPTAKQFMLIGGDAAVGHFFYDHQEPITEHTPHRAYPGCYALSKVPEEVMLSQFAIQYGINTCCLRTPWIMEKDDFRYSLSFGDDVFGGPVWSSLVAPEVAKRCQAEGTVPLLREARQSAQAEFVHVEDLVAAILAALDNPLTGNKLYNICMDEPVDYGAVAAYLKETRGLDYLDIPSNYHSNRMDNTRAKFELGWRPRYDLARLIEAAWTYRRAPGDSRKVWYPG
jgi:UDP-glucose 4-epimerase